jgi:hypothetical protein
MSPWGGFCALVSFLSLAYTSFFFQLSFDDLLNDRDGASANAVIVHVRRDLRLLAKKNKSKQSPRETSESTAAPGRFRRVCRQWARREL